ncbi:Cytochrome P450 [Sergentomyia squamirostris]
MIGCAISCLVGFVFSKWGLLAGALGFLAYKWSISTYGLFEERGLKYIPPLPFFGSFKDLFLQTKNFSDMFKELYNYYPNEKLYGVYEMRKPLFMIRDPELIKQMCVKDFDHFLDHRVNLDENQEPLFGKNLFALKGQRWRDMRSTLSPAFTGSKMRTMFQLVSECCSDTVKYLEKENKDGRPMSTEMKDLFTRFTNDVIATSAFGIKVDSFNNKDNEFYLAGKKATDFGGIRGVVFFLLVQFPKLSKLVGLRLFPEKFCAFFRSLVWDTIKYREKENIIRPDMINLLIQARKGKLNYEAEDYDKEGYAVVEETKVGEAINQAKLEEDDLTAQCLIFFLAGFDTSSTCMSFTAHELAVNPEVQKKLLEEVDATYEKLEGKPLTYEALQNMPYLDMVISESLRYWPPAIGTDRQCMKPYTIKVDGRSYDVKVGEGISIPIVGIHHDPQYFPDPSKFDPERFSEENKHNIVPFTYLPFGVGPRNCIGSRFALMETKAIIYYILSKFTFEVSEKTQVPLKLAKAGFALKPEKGFWLDLKPRVK